MPISAGFYKKIYHWIIDEVSNNVVFRPFIANGNPYKSRVFLVSPYTLPLLEVEKNNEKMFAEALVNRALLLQLYEEEMATASREFKGSLQFEKWLSKHNESLILTALNTYQVESNEATKKAEKEDEMNFTRGREIFNEVLLEFQPEIIILQGTAAFAQFKTLYAEKLTVYNSTKIKMQELEEEGPFAELHYDNGKTAFVFATRSMSYYGKDGATFEHLKKKIVENL